jgi:hypothetical protein
MEVESSLKLCLYRKETSNAIQSRSMQTKIKNLNVSQQIEDLMHRSMIILSDI